MPTDPFAELFGMINKQAVLVGELANLSVMTLIHIATLPIQGIGSMTEGKGIFSAKMSTNEMVNKNIFGAGS